MKQGPVFGTESYSAGGVVEDQPQRKQEAGWLGGVRLRVAGLSGGWKSEGLELALQWETGVTPVGGPAGRHTLRGGWAERVEEWGRGRAVEAGVQV